MNLVMSELLENNTSTTLGSQIQDLINSPNIVIDQGFRLYTFFETLLIITICGIFSNSHIIISKNFLIIEGGTIVLTTVLIKIFVYFTGVLIAFLICLFVEISTRFWMSFAIFSIFTLFYLVEVARLTKKPYKLFSDLDHDLNRHYNNLPEHELLLPGGTGDGSQAAPTHIVLGGGKTEEKSLFKGDRDEDDLELERLLEDKYKKTTKLGNKLPFAFKPHAKRKLSIINETQSENNSFSRQVSNDEIEDYFNRFNANEKRNRSNSLNLSNPNIKLKQNNVELCNALKTHSEKNIKNFDIEFLEEKRGSMKNTNWLGDLDKGSRSSNQNIEIIQEDDAENNNLSCDINEEHLNYLKKFGKKKISTFPKEFIKKLLISSFFNIDFFSILGLLLGTEFDIKEVSIGIFTGVMLFILIIFALDNFLAKRMHIIKWMIISFLFYSVIVITMFIDFVRKVE